MLYLLLTTHIHRQVYCTSELVTLTDLVSIQCLPFLADWLCIYRGEWDCPPVCQFDMTILLAVSLFKWFPCSTTVHPAVGFSGAVLSNVLKWISVITNTMVGGEPLIHCILFTWQRYYASHHDHSFTCHVPAIKEDPHPPSFNILCCHDLLCRDCKHHE